MLSLFVLSGCSSIESEPQASKTGADRDKHGCIHSAGYAWCNQTKQCERQWELAKQQGFENNAQAFQNYCGQAD